MNELRWKKAAFRPDVGDPLVTDRALQQLKFSDLLPPELAWATLERRLSDPEGALTILAQPVSTRV
jgi:ATP-dependent Lhr-like helicase